MGPTTPTAESSAIILLASALAHEVKLDKTKHYIEINLVEGVVSVQELNDLESFEDDYVNDRVARGGLVILCITAKNDDGTMDFHVYSLGPEMDQPS